MYCKTKSIAQCFKYKNHKKKRNITHTCTYNSRVGYHENKRSAMVMVGVVKITPTCATPSTAEPEVKLCVSHTSCITHTDTHTHNLYISALFTLFYQPFPRPSFIFLRYFITSKLFYLPLIITHQSFTFLSHSQHQS